MATTAEMKERPAPQSKSEPIVIFALSFKSLICKTAAASIVGIDISKEKRAASTLEKPRPRAAVIVMPERLVPGIKEGLEQSQ